MIILSHVRLNQSIHPCRLNSISNVTSIYHAERQASSCISRARCNHWAAKYYLSSRSRRVLLPSAAQHAGKRFCGRLVISPARYVFASRYEAHACLVSRNWRAAATAGSAAAARSSPYIIGTATMCTGDDIDETWSCLRLDRGPSRDVRRAARFRRGWHTSRRSVLLTLVAN